MKRRTLLTATAGVVGLSAGLGSGLFTPAAAATPKDVLVIAKNIDDMITLDPAECFEFSGGEIVAQLYTRLVSVDPKDTTKLVGGIAESWTVSDDGGVLTFKIRPNLKFHSGNPVTAEDAAWSLQRVVILDKTPAFILSQFGWAADNVAENIKVTAPDTLQLTLVNKFAPTLVLNALSAGVGSIVDMKLVMSHAEGDDLGYGWLKNQSAGSGAFKLLTWKAKDAVALEANPDFYLGAPGMKRVVVRHVGEPATQLLLIQKGDADIARNLSPDQIAELTKSPDFKLQTDPKQSILYLGLNQKNSILANPKVREALRYAVDYEGLTNSLLKGQWMIHQSFLGEGMFGALGNNPYKLDIEKAKALLAESGAGSDLSITFDVPNTSPYIDMAQAIQGTFGQAGVKVELVQADQKQVLTRYRARNHDMVLMYWSPDYLDPHSTTDYFARNPDNSDEGKTKTVAWRNAWDIPELTKATDAAALEPDTAKREQAYLDIQKEVQAQGAYILMFQQVEQSVLRSNVQGFVSGPTFDTVNYSGVTKT
ncbi:MAG TPA: ABC transporter substrate-binding protein [Geminicoccus sp.]|jgi:peptide/nickel transport system substrate-binding protein|uniref:ABC transporter substrate-binding protein n=1 Tax=Geminicoccus sp. TaxID=2024832 RepID=UPI002E37EC2E|nr:ABC transporter substrate-binding protein [Geminicoccus sp.]HEX2527643.1 ABC transporter substrate-binding protein [Geminicoccus sp.]